jgi:subtilisin family serine protease
MRGLGAALSALAVLVFPGAVTASHTPEPADYKRAELLVRFEGSSTAAARADAVADFDATVVQRLPLNGLVRVRLEPGMSVAAAEAAFERRPEVRYAQPNHLYRIDASPNDPDFVSLWGLHQASDADIDAPEAWDTTTGSDAVTVAVVDTGIDYNHVDFRDGVQSNIWLNDDPIDGLDNDGNGKVDDLRGWNFAANTNDPLDDHDHGTHVAGTIGARGNNSEGITGVNWRVKLMAVKAADASGLFSDSSIVQSFQYACANGAKVINGSFGGGSFSQAELDAINACPGSLFVFSAGNGGGDGVGDNNDALPHYPCSYPAPNIVCVAASDLNDTRASFSNFGVSSVDLAAPGEGILSTIPGDYDVFDGTSMAAPHVAGAAALVLADRPALTTLELRRALLLAAETKPAYTGLVATGARLNVRRSLSQEVTAPAGLAAQSASPSFNTWSNDTTAVASWSGATDASGVDGYSFAWSPDATFTPDEVKDVEENVTSTSTMLPDGRHWFHVRARDGVGNWGDAVHFGPFMVDTFPPARPTLSSPSHRAGVASTDRTVEINWITLGDSVSGVDGFSFVWSRQQLVAVDQTKDAEEGVVRTTSAALEPGAWWFGIRSRDNAGNWTDATVLGPFVITAVTPVCTVPRLRGLQLAGARRALVKRGCALGRVTRADSRRVRRGRVVAQRPGPGLRLRRGAKIAVVLSRGRRKR